MKEHGQAQQIKQPTPDWIAEQPRKPKGLADIPDNQVEKIPYVSPKLKEKKPSEITKHWARIGQRTDDF